MASNRWVAIDPDILIHPLVGAGQPVPPADPSRGSYSRMEAWVWLICNASFADHTVMNRGRKMTLRRGDLLGAWAFLGFQWNWSVKTVRVWIEKLTADNMLQRRTLELQMEHNGGSDMAGTDEGKQKGNQSQVLTIRNYWRYQYEPMGEGQAPWLAEGQAKGNQRASEGQHITKEQGNKEEIGAARTRGNVAQDPWKKHLNPTDGGGSQDIVFEDGEVKLLNGAKAEWLGKFGNDEERLDLALKEASQYVQPNGHRPLKAQVEGSLARIAGRRRDQEGRYQAARNTGSAKQKQASQEATHEMVERLATAADERRRMQKGGRP